MHIIGPSVVTVDHGDVLFVLEDMGGAHVSITLTLPGRPPIVHEETYQGAREAIVNLDPGTYHCMVMIAAFKYGALNAHYDTTVTANASLIAAAKGDVPQDEQSDMDFKKFDLVVV